MDGVAGGVSPPPSPRESWGAKESSHRGDNSRPFREEAADRMQWLMRTIENEIIPRLMLAHKPVHLPQPPEGLPCAMPTAHDVTELARMVLDQGAEASAVYVAGVRASGVALEHIYTELLAPVARRLGELWEADLCDFTQVTVGLWRLQQVMYDLSPVFQQDATRSMPPKRAMLVPVPGSQHSMGVLMVAEFFRRAGWDVWGDPKVSAQDVVQAARGSWFDVIGFSIGAETLLPELASVILAVRAASRNPAVAVMVGGPLLALCPERVQAVGADLLASDAAEAVFRAESLVGRPASPC